MTTTDSDQPRVAVLEDDSAMRTLLRRVFSGEEWDPNKRAVAVYISHLRTKLTEVACRKGTLASRRGVGYSRRTKALVEILD